MDTIVPGLAASISCWPNVQKFHMSDLKWVLPVIGWPPQVFQHATSSLSAKYWCFGDTDIYLDAFQISMNWNLVSMFSGVQSIGPQSLRLFLYHLLHFQWTQTWLYITKQNFLHHFEIFTWFNWKQMGNSLHVTLGHQMCKMCLPSPFQCCAKVHSSFARFIDNLSVHRGFSFKTILPSSKSKMK